MDYFTPVTGLIGGCVIGLSAAVLLLWNGDILGASGIASSFVVQPKKTFLDQSQLWKLFFVGAFFLTSRVYVTIWPDALNDERLGSDGIPFVSGAGYLVGGFLVGIGTRLGNGCVSDSFERANSNSSLTLPLSFLCCRLLAMEFAAWLVSPSAQLQLWHLSCSLEF